MREASPEPRGLGPDATLSLKPPRGVVGLAAPRPFERERDHDVGTKRSQDAHDVFEGGVVTPPVEVLLPAEREAEIGGQAEVLLGPVVAVDGGQLLAAQHGERFEELGAERVLSPVAAGERQ